MLLKNLIKNSPKSIKNLNIKGLALNSKEVKKGFIFFAIRGTKFNGENYIDKAIKNGAIIIICSKGCKFQSTKVNVIKTEKVRNYLSEISSKFYNLKPKNIIAVTGTNGKTSVADFFYHKHSHFTAENFFGFYAIFGFVVCVALVLAAKWMRTFLMRSEDYYDAE